MVSKIRTTLVICMAIPVILITVTILVRSSTWRRLIAPNALAIFAALWFLAAAAIASGTI
jgi:hypothetical protein